MSQIQADGTISFGSLNASAEQLLGRAFGKSTHIHSADLLTEPQRRNRVWRCWLGEPDKPDKPDKQDEVIPASVVIKQVDPSSYDPASPGAWDTQRFFGDWAGAEFLSKVCGSQRHGPHFYGGNRELGFIVLEDLGKHSSLVQPLLEGNAEGATQALCAFARRLGAMHADTYGKRAEFEAILRELSPHATDRMEQAATDGESEWRERVIKLLTLLTSLDVELNGAALGDIDNVIHEVTHPGPFAAFIHSDPCPDNVFYKDGHIRLIDFEFAKFGHALQDGLYGRIPFPTCWCANRIPDDIVRSMEVLYRAELGTACAAALDDTAFETALAAVCGYWTLSTLTWHLESALKEVGVWGISTIRARVLARLEMFVGVATERRCLEALCAAMNALYTRLGGLWSESSPLPLYPAFR